MEDRVLHDIRPTWVPIREGLKRVALLPNARAMYLYVPMTAYDPSYVTVLDIRQNAECTRYIEVLLFMSYCALKLSGNPGMTFLATELVWRRDNELLGIMWMLVSQDIRLQNMAAAGALEGLDEMKDLEGEEDDEQSMEQKAVKGRKRGYHSDASYVLNDMFFDPRKPVRKRERVQTVRLGPSEFIWNKMDSVRWGALVRLFHPDMDMNDRSSTFYSINDSRNAFNPYIAFAVEHALAAINADLNRIGMPSDMFHPLAYMTAGGSIQFPNGGSTWMVPIEAFLPERLPSLRFPHESDECKPFAEELPGGVIRRYNPSFERMGEFTTAQMRKLPLEAATEAEDLMHEGHSAEELAVVTANCVRARYGILQTQLLRSLTKLFGAYSDIAPSLRALYAYFMANMVHPENESVWFDPGWRVRNVDVSANYLLQMFDWAEVGCMTATVHDLIVLVLNNVMNAYDRAGFHMNLLMVGSAATSKSFALHCARIAMVEQTFRNITYQSDKSMTAGGRDFQFTALLQDEFQSNMLGSNGTKHNGDTTQASIVKDVLNNHTGTIKVDHLFINKDNQRQIQTTTAHTDLNLTACSNENLRKTASEAGLNRFHYVATMGMTRDRRRTPIAKMTTEKHPGVAAVRSRFVDLYRRVQCLQMLTRVCLNEGLIPPVTSRVAEEIIKMLLTQTGHAGDTRLNERIVSMVKTSVINRAVLTLYTHPDSPWRNKPWSFECLADLSYFLYTTVQDVVFGITVCHAELAQSMTRVVLRELVRLKFAEKKGYEENGTQDPDRYIEVSRVEEAMRIVTADNEEIHPIYRPRPNQGDAGGRPSGGREMDRMRTGNKHLLALAMIREVADIITDRLSHQYRVPAEGVCQILREYYDRTADREHSRQGAQLIQALGNTYRMLDVHSDGRLIVARTLVDTEGMCVEAELTRVLESNPHRKEAIYVTAMTSEECPSEPKHIHIKRATPQERAAASNFQAPNAMWFPASNLQRVVRPGEVAEIKALDAEADCRVYDADFDTVSRAMHMEKLNRLWTADRFGAFAAFANTEVVNLGFGGDLYFPSHMRPVPAPAPALALAPALAPGPAFVQAQGPALDELPRRPRSRDHDDGSGLDGKHVDFSDASDASAVGEDRASPVPFSLSLGLTDLRLDRRPSSSRSSNSNGSGKKRKKPTR